MESKLKLTGDALKLARSRELKKGLNVIGAIKRYFYSPNKIILSETEEIILRRLKAIWHNSCDGKSTSTIIELHTEAFDIEERQAYNDLRDAHDLFGDPRNINKHADAAIAKEMSRKLYSKSLEGGDYKAAGSALANFIKASGVDRNDPDIPDYSKIKQPDIHIHLPEGQLDIIDQLIAQNPSINLSTYAQKQAEDIQYEEDPDL